MRGINRTIQPLFVYVDIDCARRVYYLPAIYPRGLHKKRKKKRKKEKKKENNQPPEDQGCSRKRVKSSGARTRIERVARGRGNVLSRTKRIETFSGTRDKASACRWT